MRRVPLFLITDNNISTMQLKGVQLIGGHYIGLFATFDSLNGKLIPIDERYIPSSLLEWGYPPATLELLVSETALSLDESGSTDSTPKPSTLIRMMRSVSTIMPATGCDVDNLETVQANEEWNSARMFCSHQKEDGQDFFSAASIISVLPRSADSQPNIRLESCFSWPLLDESQNPGQNAVYDSSPLVAKEPLDSNQYRTRISVDLGHALFSDDKNSIPNGWKFISPIRISLERQLSTSAETAAFASRGGGLDARTVANWLGPTLNSERVRSFPLDSCASNFAWTQIESKAVDEHNSCAMDLFLAGNLTVSLRNQVVSKHSCRVDIGHITGRTNTMQNSASFRHVVSFLLPSTSHITGTRRRVNANRNDLVNSCMVISHVEQGTTLQL
jgi:hypothetical protein